MKKDKRFRKYEFASEQEALDKINGVYDEEGNIISEGLDNELYSGLIHLGFIMTKEGIYDDEGNETKAPTFSNKYSVDILWKDLEPDGWKGKKIKLNGLANSHTFYGIEYQDD